MMLPRCFAFSNHRRAACAALVCVFAGLAACTHRQDTAPVAGTTVVKAEAVQPELVQAVSEAIDGGDIQKIAALRADLRDARALLIFVGSPRAAAVARQYARLAAIPMGAGGASEATSVEMASSAEDLEDARADRWGGAQLLGWMVALRGWETTGVAPVSSFEALGCAGAEEPSSDIDADARIEAIRGYAICVIRGLDAAAKRMDQGLTPLQRAALSNLYDTVHVWLEHRVIAVNAPLMIGENDLRLAPARAWSGLAAPDAPMHLSGAMLTLRIDGASVSYRPAVSGAMVLQEDSTAVCAWPGERLMTYGPQGSMPPKSERKALADAVSSRIARCMFVGPDADVSGVLTSVDADLPWGTVLFMLRQLREKDMHPVLLAQDLADGAVTALPVTVVSSPSKNVCGVTAHVRTDGVALRGDGAPVVLVSWTDNDAFEVLTKAAKAAVSRCDASPTVRFVIDDARVDWGVVVRVIERMSWPQVCESGPCLLAELSLSR